MCTFVCLHQLKEQGRFAFLILGASLLPVYSCFSLAQKFLLHVYAEKYIMGRMDNENVPFLL